MKVLPKISLIIVVSFCLFLSATAQRIVNLKTIEYLNLKEDQSFRLTDPKFGNLLFEQKMENSFRKVTVFENKEGNNRIRLLKGTYQWLGFRKTTDGAWYQLVKNNSTQYSWIEHQVNESIGCNNVESTHDQSYSAPLSKAINELYEPVTNLRIRHPNLELREEPIYNLTSVAHVSPQLAKQFNNDTVKIKEEVETRFALMQMIYDDQVRIHIELSGINILSETQLLTQDYQGFKDYIGTHPTGAHLNHLFVERGNGGLNGQGDLGGICTGVSWSSMSEDLMFDGIVYAHEIGHLLGAHHTHNCIWPGGAIDSCASEDIICLDQIYLDESRAGSIMSYCRQPQLKFHPFVIDLMRGFTRWTLCEEFQDNDFSHIGKLDIQLKYLGKPLSVDGGLNIHSSQVRPGHGFPDFFVNGMVTNGRILENALPTFYTSVSFHSDFGYIRYPYMNVGWQTAVVTNYPTLEMELEKVIPIVGEITFDRPEKVGDYFERQVFAIFETDNPFSLIQFEETENIADFTINTTGPRKYSIVPSTNNFRYDTVGIVVTNGHDLPPIKINATYEPGITTKVVQLLDRYINGIPNTVVKFKGPVESTVTSNELGLLILANMPIGEYEIIIENNPLEIMPFADDPLGYKVIIDTISPVIVKTIIARKFAWVLPDIPELLEPHSGQQIYLDTIMLHWLFTHAGQEHTVQVARDSLFSEIIFEQNINNRRNYQGFVPDLEGEYFWRTNAKNQSGTSAWSSIWNFTTTNASTAVYTNSQTHNINIFPNPIKNSMTIRLEEPVSLKEYNILDLMGRRIMNEKIENRSEIVTKLKGPKGIYIIQFVNDQGYVVSMRKVLKI